ncbi:hypothetical protein CANARDRAFT_174197 [[Candida] arabinofermentans NRRL YB-2248]|uniref:DUF1682-domain-containing protein n=1 Tax=[Candida] arabinofermentans NRRL YB-2248 TaxID=983967 RepID=A0A1E4T5R4_9ASCO|nr:hypothetical protein CANARDRAFT_174197 [[Candida] arabinofermentans NRRL YB-2248]
MTLADDTTSEVVKSYFRYSPYELSLMTLKQRLSIYPWQTELFSIGFILIYIGLFYYGSKYNEKLVNNVINLNLNKFKENFYQVGCTKSKLVIKDDCENYTFYSTGRLNLKSMLIKFKLQARQNFFIWLTELVMSFFLETIAAPKDLINIEFEFNDDVKFDNFIWSIVTKDNMNQIRNENYYLSLTKITESSKLPIEYVFMNESPEMNELLYHKDLSELLIKCKSFLKILSITDQPIEKPLILNDLIPKKKLLLQLSIPKTPSDLESLNELLSFILDEYIDLISEKAIFRPELLKKVKKTRDQEFAKLKKIADDLLKEEINQKKLEDAKKLRSSLNDEESKKLDKKQAERKQRRQMNKQKVRA